MNLKLEIYKPLNSFDIQALQENKIPNLTGFFGYTLEDGKQVLKRYSSDNKLYKVTMTFEPVNE